MATKLSDYVAKFISEQGVSTVFAVSGGASLHLIHSVHAHPRLRLVCPHHEQGAAMGADGYARAKGDIGVAIATSGPGATNLVTGICCSFYDSVPVLYITGQVSTFRSVGDSKVRQIGFQETPIVEICRSITKYAVSIENPSRIRYELEKAVSLMRAGRQGPALVDIPDNLQRAMVDERELEGFEGQCNCEEHFPLNQESIGKLFSSIHKAKRPVVIAGWGVHLARSEEAFVKFVETYKLPVALTWGAADLLPDDHPLNLGRFGTHGMRHANFAVQNADFVLSLGSRLDTKATGSPVNSFARSAYKVMVDIDQYELMKFERFALKFDLLIQANLRDFFRSVTAEMIKPNVKSNAEWLALVVRWRDHFDRFDKKHREQQTSGVEPYGFFEGLSSACPEGASVMVDTGCSIAWAMQAWQFKSKQRLFHDFNNTAMGWALPASLGAYFATEEPRAIICIIGDGSLMMSLQELATIRHHRVPIKVFVINNSGYSMIRQTQDQWLNSEYIASSCEGGISFPDFQKLSEAFDLQYAQITNDDGLGAKIDDVLIRPGTVLCEVIVSEKSRVIPQVKFGRPNEDMDPLLARELFESQMLIPMFNS